MRKITILSLLLIALLLPVRASPIDPGLTVDGIKYDGETTKEEGRVFISGSKNGKITLREVAEEIGAEIEFDEALNVVKLTTKRKVNEAELLLLSKLIHVESNGGTLQRSLLVATTVLNRVKSGDFPDTIRGVIHDPGQFPPAKRKSFASVEPDVNSQIAALLVLNGFLLDSEVLYFNHRPFSWKSKTDLKVTEDGMYFYK